MLTIIMLVGVLKERLSIIKRIMTQLPIKPKINTGIKVQILAIISLSGI